MAQIFMNSAVVILIASAFFTTVIAALRAPDRSLQKVPVKADRPRHPNA